MAAYIKITCLYLLLIWGYISAIPGSSIGRKFKTLSYCKKCCDADYGICVQMEKDVCSKRRPCWKCTLVDCGPLSNPANGLTHVLSSGINGVAQFTCDCGYTMSGPNSAHCQANGVWSGLLPTCVLKDCGPLTAPEHGSVALVGGTTVGALAVYECEDGYYLDGPDPRECLLTGTWSLDKPVCIESVICIVPDEPNATPSYPDYIDYDHNVEYTCDSGYTHTGGDLTRYCTIDGSLTGSPPVCTLVSGPMVEIICEHDTQTLSCFEGTLSISYANYGRMEPGSVYCPHEKISDLDCSASDSMSIVTFKCEGEVLCELFASNSVYGDPCVNTYKYLEVHYTCDTGSG